ncbi:hypothetical protein CSA56_17335 [candidate division KSB3 bacterium]|uniref:Uncharacterized protein n=1 Tax=candidate division KSB3 bacterium TaxID=2044937 RepID=A0A2G6K7T8_9BACT|nr:MAG: hypothetical protein CSA56_17335 [candidate division KSB3 bacterium]
MGFLEHLLEWHQDIFSLWMKKVLLKSSFPLYHGEEDPIRIDTSIQKMERPKMSRKLYGAKKRVPLKLDKLQGRVLTKSSDWTQ